MRRVLMVRHGETDWNAINRWQGWIDIPLNATGIRQAHAKAETLLTGSARFIAVASSDLRRAQETATIIQTLLSIPHRYEDAGFRERFGGDWQGLTRDEIHTGWPEQVERWQRGELAGPPNAETTDAMIHRFDVAMQACAASIPAGDIILVTHGGIQRVVAARAGVSMHGVLKNLGSMWFEYDANGLRAHDEPNPSSEAPLVSE
jgi:broad specificity phosphatase PhoE